MRDDERMDADDDADTGGDGFPTISQLDACLVVMMQVERLRKVLFRRYKERKCKKEKGNGKIETREAKQSN